MLARPNAFAVPGELESHRVMPHGLLKMAASFHQSCAVMLCCDQYEEGHVSLEDLCG
jgi:hypothetical protein